jgi:signal transduction histidine kinase
MQVIQPGRQRTGEVGAYLGIPGIASIHGVSGEGIARQHVALFTQREEILRRITDRSPLRFVRTQLANMKSVAERTFQAVRNIAPCFGHPCWTTLDSLRRLESQGREVSLRSEVAVESANVPENLPAEYKICIHRVVQEALNNPVRHSGARNAKVGS